METSKRERVVLLGVVPIASAIVGALVNRFIGPDAQCPITTIVDGRFALLGGLLVFILVFALLATLLSDAAKRENASSVAWIGCGLFVAAGFIVALGTIERAPDLSNDDLVVLANSAEQRRDYQGAIDRLNALRQRTLGEDGQQRVQARIEALQRAQMDRVSPASNTSNAL
jgi:hypothetical protein